MNGELDIDWLIFVILLLFLIVGALIYLIYCFSKPAVCSSCGTTLEPIRSGTDETRFVCPSCGAILSKKAAFCPECGNPMKSDGTASGGSAAAEEGRKP